MSLSAHALRHQLEKKCESTRQSITVELHNIFNKYNAQWSPKAMKVMVEEMRKYLGRLVKAEAIVSHDLFSEGQPIQIGKTDMAQVKDLMVSIKFANKSTSSIFFTPAVTGK